MSVLAVIPARSGSKRIPDKNMRLVNGKPLMFYIIQKALSVDSIDLVVISTDSVEYKVLIENNFSYSNKLEVHLRPYRISGGSSKSEETVLHVIDTLEMKGFEFENTILLQPTSPLVEVSSIVKGIDSIQELKSVNSVATFVESYNFDLSDSEVLHLRDMTQDKSPVNFETGCFWIFNTKKFKEHKNRLIDPVNFIELSKTESLDIDTFEDLFIVESVIKNLPLDSYYHQRICSPDSLENSYSSIREDPDGITRDHSKEIKNKHNLCKQEIEFINSLKGGEFLDLGCGNGYIFPAISSRFNKYGLEVSESYNDSILKFIPKDRLCFGSTNCYPSETFDVVLCYHVIEHVEDPETFINDVCRIMKIHGNLIISTPDFDSIIARRFGDNFRMLHDKTHISLFSSKSLKHMLECNGFHVDLVESPFFKTDYFNKDNLLRLLDTSKTSPAFYGNIVTMYCRKK